MALAFAAKGSGDASILVLSAALVLLWLGFAALPAAAPQQPSALALCTAGFALWIVCTNLFVSPSYTAIAQYHAAFLFGGYLCGRRIGASAGAAYRAALIIGVGISAWAIWQLIQGEQRAHGPFISPATLATVLNLLILPGLVLVAAGDRRPVLIAALCFLVLALVATTSRGGWLALAGGGIFAILLLHRAGRSLRWSRAALGAGLLLVFIAGGWVLRQMAQPTQFGGFTGSSEPGGIQARLELFRLGAGAIRASDLIFGAGYDAFYYALETGRTLVPTYTDGTTHFVHNDYLQTLYELGVPGVALLLLMIVVPLVQVWRSIPRFSEDEQTLAVAAAAAVVSMALHAIVDFPFYIPICLLMFGAALGIFDAMRLRASSAKPAEAWFAIPTRMLKAAAATLAACILALPAAAEAAALHAQERLRASDGPGAAFWFEAARRLDPLDWRFHWYAGQFWMNQAAISADPAKAALADAALTRAIDANPRQPRPLATRIELHDRFRQLLATPADDEMLRGWVDRLVALAPTEAGVRAERDRIYRKYPPGERK